MHQKKSFVSSAPTQKINGPNNLILRALKISNNEFLDTNRKRMSAILKRNGFLAKHIRHLISKNVDNIQ